jgi:hypothetical protein
MRLKVGYLFITFAMLFCLWFSQERIAYAYTDPGSGLLVLQAASAFLAGILFTIRRHIKTLTSHVKPRQEAATKYKGPKREGGA